ncbi:MAG: DUF3108 domain-containing protein [Ottowia sp.]|uniref:DUF3108 domain-containing protein n=1 Tax=Ottowia sp. TaxID=1898956 RepID=UPI0039E294E0
MALAHAALLGDPPSRDLPLPAAPRAPALLTRVVAAPMPPPAHPPAATPSPPARTRHADKPPAARRPAPATRAVAPVIAETPAAAADTGADSPPATPHAPVRVPGPATLHYQVTGHARGLGYEASAQLAWRRQGERYEAAWSVGLPLPGTRTQRSEGAVTEAGLAPERFAERARGERAAHFDAAGRRIRFSANTPDAVLEPGAQDRLSATLQLAALLAAAPERYPPGTRITLQTAGVREAEPWVWEVHADETLQLAGRELLAARLLRQPRGPYDTRVELWLARSLDHLPARLRVTQANGDVTDQQLQAIDQAPQGR